MVQYIVQKAKHHGVVKCLTYSYSTRICRHVCVHIHIAEGCAGMCVHVHARVLSIKISWNAKTFVLKKKEQNTRTCSYSSRIRRHICLYVRACMCLCACVPSYMWLCVHMCGLACVHVCVCVVDWPVILLIEMSCISYWNRLISRWILDIGYYQVNIVALRFTDALNSCVQHLQTWRIKMQSNREFFSRTYQYIMSSTNTSSCLKQNIAF